MTTATESKDDCRDTHKVTGQGPSSITLGGNSESRGLFIAGQGPASMTSEGDLVVLRLTGSRAGCSTLWQLKGTVGSSSPILNR